MDAPTQKQLAYIKDISDELGYEFTGTTKEDARQWLSKYVPKYKSYCYERQLDYEAYLETIDARRDW
jgi:hypothetical protein